MAFLAKRSKKEWSKKKGAWVQRVYYCFQHNERKNGKWKSHYYGYWPANPRKPVPNAKWVGDLDAALVVAAALKEDLGTTVHIRKLKKGWAVYYYPIA